MTGVGRRRKPGREPITGGGWLTPGRCGKPHLEGRAESWWVCATCIALDEHAARQRREASRLRLQTAHDHANTLMYGAAW